MIIQLPIYSSSLDLKSRDRLRLLATEPHQNRLGRVIPSVARVKTCEFRSWPIHHLNLPELCSIVNGGSYRGSPLSCSNTSERKKKKKPNTKSAGKCTEGWLSRWLTQRVCLINTQRQLQTPNRDTITHFTARKW